jgi:hypothetical protein
MWNLQNVKGSRDAAKTKIAGEKIPDDVKAFIVSQIDAMPADVTGCKIDAYSQDSRNPSAMTITRTAQITIVGICL